MSETNNDTTEVPEPATRGRGRPAGSANKTPAKRVTRDHAGELKTLAANVAVARRLLERAVKHDDPATARELATVALEQLEGL